MYSLHNIYLEDALSKATYAFQRIQGAIDYEDITKNVTETFEVMQIHKISIATAFKCLTVETRDFIFNYF